MAKKKISFTFELIFLAIAIIFGIIVLSANFVTPFLNEYIFVGLVTLVALSIAAVVAICILVHKIHNSQKEE